MNKAQTISPALEPSQQLLATEPYRPCGRDIVPNERTCKILVESHRILKTPHVTDVIVFSLIDGSRGLVSDGALKPPIFGIWRRKSRQLRPSLGWYSECYPNQIYSILRDRQRWCQAGCSIPRHPPNTVGLRACFPTKEKEGIRVSINRSQAFLLGKFYLNSDNLFLHQTYYLHSIIFKLSNIFWILIRSPHNLISPPTF